MLPGQRSAAYSTPIDGCCPPATACVHLLVTVELGARRSGRLAWREVSSLKSQVV